jgi:hypothetical protein
MYEDVSKSFQTGRLERELQMVQLSATRCSCIAILWVSPVSFAAITLCVASQRVFIVLLLVYFVIESVRKLLDTPSYTNACRKKIRMDLKIRQGGIMCAENLQEIHWRSSKICILYMNNVLHLTQMDLKYFAQATVTKPVREFTKYNTTCRTISSWLLINPLKCEYKVLVAKPTWKTKTDGRISEWV